MNRIQYIDKGDALEPVGTGKKLILHCVNDKGRWGAGFVLALSKKWPEPEAEYRKWANGDLSTPFTLGFVRPVGVTSDIAVCNMIGQHECGRDENNFPPVRYWAIDECLKEVAALAKKFECSVHCPKLGCGLAGGEWDYIECMLNKRFIQEGIKVYVYLWDE